MRKKTWPVLYKKASTGKLVEWRSEVEGSTIVEHWGYVGGKMQSTSDTITEGKNIGRANETTPEQQAILEAEAKWTKKLKKDYTKEAASAEAGESSDLIEGGILPMLAHKYSEHGDKLTYPCFVQPKLDGHRCVYIANDATLWSRTRKQIRSVPHISDLLKRCRMPYNLDGELYNHAYRDKFEQLTHFIRQETPEEGSEAVQYHVYDAPLYGSFRDRLKDITNELKRMHAIPRSLGLVGSVQLVETREVNDEDELMLAFEDFLAQGYEGAIARNADGLYVNKRSYDLLKIKKFDDAEFECVRVEEGRGKLAGHAVFVCVTNAGTEFNAKMKGAQSELKRYFDKPKLVVGKQVTVKYQGITNKSKVPRFPVALRVKDNI